VTRASPRRTARPCAIALAASIRCDENGKRAAVDVRSSADSRCDAVKIDCQIRALGPGASARGRTRFACPRHRRARAGPPHPRSSRRAGASPRSGATSPWADRPRRRRRDTGANRARNRRRAADRAALPSGRQVPPPRASLHADLAIAVLAAGGSRRLGRPTPLVEIDGTPLVRGVAATCAAAAAGPVAVVLGAHAASAATALIDLRVTLVAKEAWNDGIASSIRAAVRWAETTRPEPSRSSSAISRSCRLRTRPRFVMRGWPARTSLHRATTAFSARRGVRSLAMDRARPAPRGSERRPLAAQRRTSRS
jgi:hypothetical protein